MRIQNCLVQDKIFFLILSLHVNASRANLNKNKRIFKWWPFWNKVYSYRELIKIVPAECWKVPDSLGEERTGAIEDLKL